MIRRNLRWTALLAVFGVSVACENKPSGSASPGTASAPVIQSAAPEPSAAAVPRAEDRGRRRGARGPVAALLASARDLELKPEQKATLEKIESELRGPVEGKAGPPQSGMKEAGEVMAAGVKAGKIDAAKLEPHLAAMREAGKAHREKEAKALNDLHHTLDATQRKAFVEGARSMLAKREERAPKHDESAGKGEAHRAERSKREIERLTKNLNLDAEQQKKVEQLIAKRPQLDAKAGKEASKKRMDAVLVAFEKEAFDATKLDLGPDKMQEGFDGRIEYLNSITAILTSEQREKFATSMNAPRGLGMGRPRGHDDSDEVDDLGLGITVEDIDDDSDED